MLEDQFDDRHLFNNKQHEQMYQWYKKTKFLCKLTTSVVVFSMINAGIKPN